MTWRWWMTLLVIAAVLFLIGCIPVGGDVRYGEGGLTVKAKIGLLRLQLLPKTKKKQKKQKKAAAKKPKKPAEPKPKGDEKRSIQLGGIDGILQILELVSDTLGDLRRKLRVDALMLHVTFNGSDPAQAAMNYGRAWAVIGAVTPTLERLFVIKKRDIQPILDYNETEMKAEAHLILTITIGRILSLACKAGFRGLGILKELKKGGAANESSSV